jgi:hypothetical protein
LDHLAELDRLGSEPWREVSYYNRVYSKAFAKTETGRSLRGMLRDWSKNG